MGTPAEEGGGGKIVLLEAGAFDDVDCAMMAHPSWVEQTRGPGLAIQRLDLQDNYTLCASGHVNPLS